MKAKHRNRSASRPCIGSMDLQHLHVRYPVAPNSSGYGFGETVDRSTSAYAFVSRAGSLAPLR